MLFGLLSYQDSAGGPPTVSYIELMRQVEDGDVAEVLSPGDRIEGVLEEAAQRPSDDGGKGNEREDGDTYSELVTHRSSFAQDDLLVELEEQGAHVLAESVEQQRGLLVNLRISLAPSLLLIGFYWWLFRRQRQSLGGSGGLFGGGKRQPVDPEKVRVTFDVAGIDEVEAEISGTW